MEALKDSLVVGSSLQIAETMHSEFFGICSLLIVVFLVDSRFWKKNKCEGQIPYDLTFNWNIINKRKKQTKY